jgi:hypothetical protein
VETVHGEGKGKSQASMTRPNLGKEGNLHCMLHGLVETVVLRRGRNGEILRAIVGAEVHLEWSVGVQSGI